MPCMECRQYSEKIGKGGGGGGGRGGDDDEEEDLNDMKVIRTTVEDKETENISPFLY